MFHIWIYTHIPTVDEPSPTFFNIFLDLHLKPTLKFSYSRVRKLIDSPRSFESNVLESTLMMKKAVTSCCFTDAERAWNK